MSKNISYKLKLNNYLKESKISNYEVLLFYFLYTIIIILSSLVFCKLYINKFDIVDDNFNIILENITFGHGKLISNFFYNNELSQDFEGIKFFLKKTLALPFLIIFLGKISLNFYFIVICKNLILFSIYFWIVFYCWNSENREKYKFIIFILIPIVIPNNFLVSLNFNYEDNLVSIFLPIIYILLISKNNNFKYFFLSLFLFLLYFIKSSMFFLVLLLPFIIIMLEKNSKAKYIPLIFSLLAILTWGGYGYIKTKSFPVGPKGLSLNTYVMSFAMNENFHKFYPKYSTDLIPINKNLIHKFNNEWEFYDYYKEQNSKYLKLNLKRYFKDTIIKIKFIFFNIHKDGSLNINSSQKLIFSFLINKLFFNLSIVFLISYLINKLFFKKNNLLSIKANDIINLYFLVLLTLSLTPHIIVWATSKHLVGITNVCIIYFFEKIFNRSKINEKN